MNIQNTLKRSNINLGEKMLTIQLHVSKHESMHNNNIPWADNENLQVFLHNHLTKFTILFCDHLMKMDALFWDHLTKITILFSNRLKLAPLHFAIIWRMNFFYFVIVWWKLMFYFAIIWWESLFYFHDCSKITVLFVIV